MKMILSCLVVLCVLLTSCVAVQPVPANNGTSTAEPMEDATPTEGSASTEAVAETGAMTPTVVSVPFAAIQVIQDFAPGSWSPVHSHGGPVLVTVLEGEITLRQEVTGEEAVYAAGDFWIEEAGKVHMAGNDGQENARVAVVFLLPEGANLTTVQESPNTKDAPGPTVISRTSMSMTESLGNFEAIQVILDFAPGSRSPVHSHGGPVLVTVLEGEVTYRPEETGVETDYSAGEFWTEEAGALHVASNAGQENARVAALYLSR